MDDIMEINLREQKWVLRKPGVLLAVNKNRDGLGHCLTRWVFDGPKPSLIELPEYVGKLILYDWDSKDAVCIEDQGSPISLVFVPDHAWIGIASEDGATDA